MSSSKNSGRREAPAPAPIPALEAAMSDTIIVYNSANNPRDILIYENEGPRDPGAPVQRPNVRRSKAWPGFSTHAPEFRSEIEAYKNQGLEIVEPGVTPPVYMQAHLKRTIVATAADAISETDPRPAIKAAAAKRAAELRTRKGK